MKNWTELDFPERFDELSNERKDFLLNWIKDNLTPIKNFNERYTSYSLKEYIKTSYFTNGEIKGAMLKSGYKVKDKNALNWSFNISQKSPLFIEQKKY